MKLFGKFLLTCAQESVGEVFAVARKAEIDPNTVFEVLSGSLFGAPAYQTHGPRIIKENFSPAGSKMPLGLKDIRLVFEAEGILNARCPSRMSFATVFSARSRTAVVIRIGLRSR